MGGKAKARDLERVAAIREALRATWGHAVIELDYRTPFELLCATILAAQSTDKGINQITPALFARYPDAHALALADQVELERLIFKSGFYRAKARSLLGMARMLVAEFGGEVPRTMEEMVRLPGVARKTANVVLGTALGVVAGIVVDTHVTRVSNRLELTTSDDPVEIEQDLMAVIPVEEWVAFAHQMIWHGRRICHARKPDCDHCPLALHCPSAGIAGAASA
jgi:endonuclease III